MRTVRTHLSYANVMASVAVFIALGGTSYAAIKVTGKNVKDSSLTGRDIRNSSLTGSDVRDRSLLSRDFRDGQLPAGPPGAQGAQGAPGRDGADGQTGPVGPTFARSTFTPGTACNPPDINSPTIPDDESVRVDCATLTVTLPTAGRLLLRGETDWLADDNGAAANCNLKLDGTALPETTGPGQTDGTHQNSDFAVRMGHTGLTAVTPPVAAGEHTVRFGCADTYGGGGLGVHSQAPGWVGWNSSLTLLLVGSG